MKKVSDMKNATGLYVVWNPFQRRAESISEILGLHLYYFHTGWEEKNKFLKLASYIVKSVQTLRVLQLNKPRYVFVQLAPTPLLYTVFLYRLFAKVEVISDCHNTMIYDDHWISWPLAKYFLRESYITLTHNTDVQRIAKDLDIETVVLRDPLPTVSVVSSIVRVAGIHINEEKYVIIPCGIAPDEPIDSLFESIRLLPNIKFVMTWFVEKMSSELRDRAPDNLLFTGYLEKDSFNALFAHADAALVLTTREGTQPSGAAEAIALAVPLVVSRIRTTSRLYGDAPILVENTPYSIAEGVKKALSNKNERVEAIATLRSDLEKTAGDQIKQIKKLISEIS